MADSLISETITLGPTNPFKPVAPGKPMWPCAGGGNAHGKHFNSDPNDLLNSTNC